MNSTSMGAGNGGPMITIAFCSNRGGVGKTSLVYHLAWTYADMGVPVVAADLDPQANLSSMFLEDERLEELWPEGRHAETIHGAIQPLLEGTGDVVAPHVEFISDNLGLLVGDLALSMSEERMHSQWSACMDRAPRAFRVISAFWRTIETAAAARGAAVVLLDVGPNLGAINRSVLISSQHVVIPLAPELYSLQGLRNLGPTLLRWREDWSERRARNPVAGLSLPPGDMKPAGYVLTSHSVRLDRPARARDRCMELIPELYASAILGGDAPSPAPLVLADPNCLARTKQYRSLMSLAQEARRPMFSLRPADGAIGGHAQAVEDCRKDFTRLATRIAAQVGLALPSGTAGRPA